MTERKKGRPTPPKEPTFVDNPHAPEAFADEAFAFSLIGGNVVIALTRQRVDHSACPGPVNHVVIGRLVMPAQGAWELSAGLFGFLKERGFGPPEGGLQ